MALADFKDKVELDVALNGNYSTDISAYLYEIPSCRRGRESALQRFPPGEMTLKLNNSDGRFSPDKGTYSGLDQFVPVRWRRTWTTPAVTNIDDNPSAEVDAVGATGVVATVARDTVESWVGGASFKVTTTNADNSGVEKKLRSGSRFAVTAALAYTWAPRLKGVAGKSMTVEMLWYNSGGANFQTDIGALVFGLGWIQTALTVTAPTGAVTLVLRVLTDGAQGVFDFWLDASWLYQGATLLPYADGDQPGCSWTGTAHQSTSARATNPVIAQFNGFVTGFELGEDRMEQVATLTCHDRLTLLPQKDISLGLMLQKGTALILHRVLDKVEGELITNPGIESIQTIGAGAADGYTAVGGATISAETGANAFLFEGDRNLRATPSGSQALSGWSYAATADLTQALVYYEIACYARAETGTVAVRLRALRDGAVQATTTVTLTTSWQRIELEVVFITLGTARTIELVTDVASTVQFRHDALHAVRKVNAIARSFDAGTFSPTLITAFHESAGQVLQDVLNSEPGFLFLDKSGTAVFKDKNRRPAATVPKAVFGDGDGLLQFGNGLAYSLDPADRVSTVTVRSRGTPSKGTGTVVAWQLAPEHDVAVGDKFRARYSQPLFGVRLTEKSASMKVKNVNWGSGCDIEMETAVVNYYGYLDGSPYNYPSEESSVTKEADTGLPVQPPLEIDMPLQGTSSAEMNTEAQRLIDRYKNKIVRLGLPLGNSSDEVTAWQMGLELNDLIIVRAKSEPHSPNINKKFWVEGIQHRLGKGSVLETVLSLEEL